MKCNGTKFDTCDHSKWVTRDCAPGTACKPNGDSIVCDHANAPGGAAPAPPAPGGDAYAGKAPKGPDAAKAPKGPA
jgi:hypothetical protein